MIKIERGQNSERRNQSELRKCDQDSESRSKSDSDFRSSDHFNGDFRCTDALKIFNVLCGFRRTDFCSSDHSFNNILRQLYF